MLTLEREDGSWLTAWQPDMLLFSGFKFWNCYLLVSLNPVEKTLLQTCEKDGVSESQVTQVINIELDQIIEAFKFLDEKCVTNMAPFMPFRVILVIE